MRETRLIIALACALALLIAATPAAAEVDWDSTLTDPADDVINVAAPGTPLTDHDGVDILEVSSAMDGDDLNVTLTLAGHHVTDGVYTYAVYGIADGDEELEYAFTMTFFGWSYATPTDAGVASSSISADGSMLSWLVPLSEVGATTSFEVVSADATHVNSTTFQTFVDDVGEVPGNGNGNGNGEEPTEPMKMTVHYNIMDVGHIRMTMSMWAEGEYAEETRSNFDTDEDGTVSQTEYDTMMDLMSSYMGDMNESTMKLDGKVNDRTGFEFSYDGLVGPVDSTDPVITSIILDVYWDNVTEADTHTYGDGDWDDDEGGDEDGMWNVTDDSWFKMEVASPWKFDTTGWSADMKGLLKSDDRVLEFTGADLQTKWNTTMADTDSIVITKNGGGGDGDGDDDDSPGFGALMAASALMAALVLASRRRR